jgi:hypothetical protein
MSTDHLERSKPSGSRDTKGSGRRRLDQDMMIA